MLAVGLLVMTIAEALREKVVQKALSPARRSVKVATQPRLWLERPNDIEPKASRRDHQKE